MESPSQRSPQTVQLEPLRVDDIAAAMALEREDDNRPWVRQWSEAQYQSGLNSADYAVLKTSTRASEPGLSALIILAGMNNPDENAELKRMIIADKRQGLGRLVLRASAQWAFERGASRVWLEVLPNNRRALGLYRSEGFRFEGTHRSSFKSGNERHDLAVLSLLRREFEERVAAGYSSKEQRVGVSNFDLDGRLFAPIANSPAGTVNGATIFAFRQDEASVTATYSGGAIEYGQIVGSFVGEQELELLYQCRTIDRELKAGRALVQVSKVLADTAEGDLEEPRLRLSMNWAWLTGDRSAGTSEYLEL